MSRKAESIARIFSDGLEATHIHRAEREPVTDERLKLIFQTVIAVVGIVALAAVFIFAPATKALMLSVMLVVIALVYFSLRNG